MNKTLLFDFKTGDFIINHGDPVTITGIDALKMRVEKIIRTQYGLYRIYRGKEYGANIHDLVIGHSLGIGFTASELEREIRTALLRDEEITAVSDFKINQTGTVLNISITLKTDYGDMSEVYTF